MCGGAVRTDENQVRNLLGWVISARLDDLRDGVDVVPSFLFLRDNELVGVLEMGWTQEPEKEAVLELAKGVGGALCCDALAVVADAYVSINPGVMPSADVEAREALFALAQLADGRRLCAAVVYGRSDSGDLYVDQSASAAFQEGFGDGFIAQALFDVVRAREVSEVLDALLLKELCARAELGGGVVSFAPKLDFLRSS